MLNFAELPSIAGDDWFCESEEVGVPPPAAQICPARPDPGGNNPPHDCHPGIA